MAMPILEPLAAGDPDPDETQEWIDSIRAVIRHDGAPRAHYLLARAADSTRRAGEPPPFNAATDYVNTIPVERQASMPGDAEMERRIRAAMRWNAAAMVVRANRKPGDLGGHLATYA